MSKEKKHTNTIYVNSIPYDVSEITEDELIELEFLKNGAQGVERLEEIVGPGAKGFGGLCDGKTCKIYINKGMPEAKKQKVLLHEIIEAVDQECCLELDHNVIEAIATAILQTGRFDASGVFNASSKKSTTGSKPKRKARVSKQHDDPFEG